MPPTPPPPARVELTFAQPTPVDVGKIGVSVNVTERRPEILPAEGMEHCDPKVEEWSAAKTAIVGPAYPDQPGYEAFVQDVWSVHSAEATFTVAGEHEECWNEDIWWAQFGGPPFVPVWLCEGWVQRTVHSEELSFSSTQAYLSGDSYTIVK